MRPRVRMCVCVRNAAYLYMLYMISSFPVQIDGHFINRLFYTEANTTSKTTICDRKHTKSQVVAICRTRLLWNLHSWNRTLFSSFYILDQNF